MQQHEIPLAHTKRLVAGPPQTRPLAYCVDAAANTADCIFYRKINLYHSACVVSTIVPAQRNHLPGKDHSRKTRHCVQRVARIRRKCGLLPFLSCPAYSHEE
jgi:hypothetical protein